MVIDLNRQVAQIPRAHYLASIIVGAMLGLGVLLGAWIVERVIM